MILFEFTLKANDSDDFDERAFAWAPDEATARQLFAARHPNVKADSPTVKQLSVATDVPFCTKLGTENWWE